MFFFFLVVLFGSRFTNMKADISLPAVVIADSKIISQFDGGFSAWKFKQSGNKINHISVSTAPEAMEAVIYFHAGSSIIVKRTASHTISLYSDSIKFCRLPCGYIPFDGFKYIHHIFLS